MVLSSLNKKENNLKFGRTTRLSLDDLTILKLKYLPHMKSLKKSNKEEENTGKFSKQKIIYRRCKLILGIL